MVSVKQAEYPSGLPPWHAVLLVAILSLFSLSLFPSLESIDSVSTLDTFTKRIFPDLLSLEALIAIRVVSCVLILSFSGYALYVAYDPARKTMVITPYKPKSKLKRGVPVDLRRWYSQAPFTMWSWNLLGVSFGLNAYLGYQGLLGKDETVNPCLLRTALLLFETTAPVTLLIAFVVRYAMWPQALKNGSGDDPTLSFKQIRVLAFHNLNVILALSEISVWGGIPVRYRDFPVGVLYGVLYVLFTWAIRNNWDPTGKSPQFLYFFFDTTLGATTSIAIVVLLAILVIFYGLFCILHQILEHLGGGFWTHAVAVFVLSCAVCRFRD